MDAIGVDIGGTKLAVGLASDGALTTYREQPLPTRDYDLLLRTVRDAVHALPVPASRPSAPLGVAVAAWLTADREAVLAAANLAWTGRPFRRDLAASTGLDTVLVNDADAAAWGEYLAAGEPDAEAMVVLTLGTDVGGGVVVNGRLLTGATGVAGELGHLEVDADGDVCVCGARGCLATYASGTAMVAYARDRLAAGAEGPVLLAACGGDPGALTGADLAAGVRRGDPVALATVDRAAGAIAVASGQISRVIDHGCLVLGGGVSGLGEVLLDAVRRALRAGVRIGPVLPTPMVTRSRLGNGAGVLGAADLAWRTLRREARGPVDHQESSPHG